jgi:SAM-dependent methyltransferase
VATVEENRRMWDHAYSWPEAGDEWSSGWGGPGPQWSEWILPRLTAVVGSDPCDVETIVEIGCGHGRWTQFLAAGGAAVVAVDLAAGCIDACERRFADRSSVRPTLCDGASLPGVADASVDLVFSFDSLVHADATAVEGYVSECARVLRPDGVAYLHHSNLAACGLDGSALVVPVVRRLLASVRLAEPNVHWRDPTVDADLVARLAAAHGMVCVEQELLRWGTRRRYIDGISVLRHASGHPGGEPRRVANPSFMADMARIGGWAARQD